MQTVFEDRYFPSAHAGTLRTHWRLGLRLVFGVFWGADALLKWTAYVQGFDYIRLLKAQAEGQPPIVASWIDGWARAIGNFPNFSLFIAIVETMIAVFILVGLLTNLTCTIGIAFSFLIWSTAEGFGGIFMDGATDIGPSPLYMALFAGLIIAMAGRYYGLDAKLSRMYPKLAFLM